MDINKYLISLMGNQIKLIERSKDGYIDAISYLRQWNDLGIGAKKDMCDYFKSTQTRKFIEKLMIEYDLYTPKMVYEKSQETCGDNVGWMHPILFIDFVMWVDSDIKMAILKFLQNKIIW